SCSYCAIPIITGRHHSRPIEDLEEEVRALVRRGTHEFQLIAQDLTFYGIDLYGGNRLAELTERLSDIKGVEWLRLHYAYPAHFPLDLLRVMRERPNVCKYLDMALQHISDPMLKLMRRQITKAETYDLIETIRREVPGIHLRTTLMTGHPGETDADFAELLQFVRDIRFERLGAFTYSHESGTYCDKYYQDKIPESVKQERLGELMAVQERIAATYNEAKVGSRMRVVIDRAEDGFYIGRTEYDSPEVDPEVLIPFVDGQVLKPGQFHMAEITEAEPFDLYARIID
uniref:MiaB/RimO family radical SAM methylthiotransferase n=1 Tax=Porphyromonas loveana TaxID=1884669 RepID=UPI0035A13A79